MIKCLSINLWNINPPLNSRMDSLKKFITETNPDIICFQEVSYLGNKLQIDFLKEDFNYEFIYAKSDNWEGREEGLAIASFYPITNYEVIHLPSNNSKNDMQRILLRVDVSINDTILSVYNTHLAYHKDSRLCRIHQTKEIAKTINTAHNCNSHVILCGDFNSFPKDEILEYIINDRSILYNTCLYDSFSFSNANKYVSPKLWPNRNIDYIFASQKCRFESRLCMCETDGYPVCSDHYGVISKGDLL